ncbi:hypothetical protein CcBV_3.1 [Bracoviriform congregatae]|uniref:Uncharacterized protein n=1 Tax=Bracoviriform congregatae TaxID=39640 RepID=Q5ZP58_9VIRU|nr:hypothetical protein CcBV_3.1 [Bracoviriform congregatae]CAG17395.1 hypothetical protein CcBV_3.1 [Bracoviriform congregatae]
MRKIYANIYFHIYFFCAKYMFAYKCLEIHRKEFNLSQGNNFEKFNFLDLSKKILKLGNFFFCVCLHICLHICIHICQHLCEKYMLTYFFLLSIKKVTQTSMAKLVNNTRKLWYDVPLFYHKSFILYIELGGAVVVVELDIDLVRGCSWRGGTLKYKKKSFQLAAATSRISSPFSPYATGPVYQTLQYFFLTIQELQNRGLKKILFHGRQLILLYKKYLFRRVRLIDRELPSFNLLRTIGLFQ